MKGRELAHHALVVVLLVSMDGLCMLTEVVETGKLLCAVTCKGAFAGVFSKGVRHRNREVRK
jgi:hypothetical protein